MKRQLPSCPNLDQLKHQARDLVNGHKVGDKDAVRRMAHAARNNESAVVRAMLKSGWPVDSRGQENVTPLHWAAFHGNYEMVKANLSFDPPLEVTDADFNGTPLGWAVHGSEEGWYRQNGDYGGTVEALIAAGARLPERLGGSEAVREVLRRHGMKEESN